MAVAAVIRKIIPDALSDGVKLDGFNLGNVNKSSPGGVGEVGEMDGRRVAAVGPRLRQPLRGNA
jgi:hypothetical protein